MLVALRPNPSLNSSWDEAAQEIVTKHYVNLGIAAATPRGLMVPNIKDAQSSLWSTWRGALADLTAYREGGQDPADLTGGTITITNVGVFGVDAGTPILNPGEAAILCFGSIRRNAVGTRGRDRVTVGDDTVACRSITDWSTANKARNSSPSSVVC